MIEIRQGDNLPILRSMDEASFDLVYIDPPFNTGKAQTHTRVRTVRDDDGDRRGFAVVACNATITSGACRTSTGSTASTTTTRHARGELCGQREANDSR